MIDLIDTSSTPLNYSVPEGFVKAFGEQSAELESMTSVPQPTSSSSRFADPLAADLVAHSNRGELSFHEWIVFAASRASRSLMAVLAATQINLAKLSWEDRRTSSFDFASLTRVLPAEFSIPVSITADLVASPDDTAQTTLLAPSGLYLTWLEMLEDVDDDATE